MASGIWDASSAAQNQYDEVGSVNTNILSPGQVSDNLKGADYSPEYIFDEALGLNTSVKGNLGNLVPGQDALSQLARLSKDNPEYMELYLKLLAERENTTNAQAWYEKMSGSQYQRAAEDLRKAGLNPYLALNSLGGAGSGSVAPAGTWSTSPYANKVSQESYKAQARMKALGVLGTAMVAVLALVL